MRQVNLSFCFSFNSTLIFSLIQGKMSPNRLIFSFSFSFYILFLFDTGLHELRAEAETGENVEDVEYDRPLVRCESVKDKPHFSSSIF